MGKRKPITRAEMKEKAARLKERERHPNQEAIDARRKRAKAKREQRQEEAGEREDRRRESARRQYVRKHGSDSGFGEHYERARSAQIEAEMGWDALQAEATTRQRLKATF